MKKMALPLMLLIVISSAIPSFSAEPVIPAITRPVNDYADIISPDYERKISDMIVAHREKTGIQMAVLTVRTTGGMDIEEFSIKTAEQWGGGTKERDDGLLFTVAVFDRRMRIEVGYGLEGYITDLRAGRILDGIREEFRSYKYGEGVEKAVSQIISATDEVRPGEEAPASVRFRGAFSHVVEYYALFFILGAIFAVLLIFGKLRGIINIPITVALGLCLVIGVPILFKFFLHGVWYWTQLLYLMGAFAGGAMVAAVMVPEKKKFKIIAAVIMAVPVLTSLISIIYFLQVVKPVAEGTSKNETILLGILIGTNIFQFFILGALGGSSDGGGSSGSGSSGSSSSDSSSSSSSSGDSSYSGGGGSYGGGGATSSW